MNRLQIVLKYCSLSTKVNQPSKYKRAQLLKARIIAKEDKYLRNNDGFRLI